MTAALRAAALAVVLGGAPPAAADDGCDCGGAAGPAAARAGLAFVESFEDTAWQARGWYDGPRMRSVADPDAPHGERVLDWHWRAAGDVQPAGGGARLPLPAARDVTVRFALRLSADWSWTGRSWHPHMFHFLTDVDDDYVGPAWTHLTTYVEVVDGVPRLALQDGRNIDTARVGEDLTATTAARAVAGCNGDSDGYGPGDCYQGGAGWVNGKVWEAPAGALPADGDWHVLQARFRLNSIDDGGRARRDGILQLWVDGTAVLDVRDAVLRTGAHPGMRFDQFLMAPYFGPGVPHEQHMWIDDLRIWTGGPPADTAAPARSWGDVKAGAR